LPEAEGLSCIYGGRSRIAEDGYYGEFLFNQAIKLVTVDLSGELIQDSETDMKIAMMRQ
jgi:hypothetical protein